MTTSNLGYLNPIEDLTLTHFCSSKKPTGTFHSQLSPHCLMEDMSRHLCFNLEFVRPYVECYET
jgi:hypothetical protein